MSTLLSSRPLEESDIDPVLDLMRLALGEPPMLKRTAELFRWKHLENPFGASIALVAEEAGQIVGLRTFMRWELHTGDEGGERLRCIRAVDTATHPQHRRKGIFRRLTEEALEIARDEGVDMVFNTPNALSKPGYLSMGWEEVGAIGAMVRPSLSLLRAANSQDLSDPQVFLRGSRPFEGVSSPDRPPVGLRTPRDDAYFNWRFGSHPHARYHQVDTPHATAILRPNIRNGRRELVLADVVGDAREAIEAAIGSRGSAYLATWFSRGTVERSAAIRHGFVPVPGFTALTLVMRSLRELPDSYRDLESWDMAVGDFELL